MITTAYCANCEKILDFDTPTFSGIDVQRVTYYNNGTTTTSYFNILCSKRCKSIYQLKE